MWVMLLRFASQLLYHRFCMGDLIFVRVMVEGPGGCLDIEVITVQAISSVGCFGTGCDLFVTSAVSF